MKRFAPPEAIVLLMLESSEHPMHLGALEVFRPPEGSRPDFAREIYEAMRTLRDVTPAYAGHPALTRRGTSQLRWSYDDHVDIDYHVRYTLLPPPGGTNELFAVVDELHSRLLDREKPLWECHLIDGLNDGRFAMYIKAHHAMADGATGAKILQDNLSTDPHDMRIRMGWTPRPELPSVAVPGSAPQEPSTGMARTVVGVRRSLSLMRDSLRDRQLIPAFRAPRTIFNVARGGPRRCAAQSWPLDRVKDVGRAAGVTTNDVALGMSAGALRAYLAERNGLPDTPLVAMVPVDLRSGYDGDHANVLGAAVCNLATDVDDPAKRLDMIHASMQRNVQIIRELPRQLAIHLAGLICAPIGGASGLGARIPPIFNLAITHVRGISEPLYWRGARLEALYPLAPTLRGQALNFGLFTSADSLNFGIAGCAAAVPDPERLLGHLETSLKDLELAVGV